MRYGFYLPTRGPTAEADALAALVGKGEEWGFDSVMIADHIVFPASFESKYPYTVTGAFPGQGDGLEQLTLMTFVAARTRRLRLVSSVMVLPQRHPVLTAKTLASIDVLSGGRVTVGVGVGWLREEFEALGVDHFDRRGAATNEYIEAMKKLWTEDPVSYSGEFCRFENVHCLPHPVQKPHPPLWIGGESLSAMRRAVRLGDAWFPIGNNPKFPMETAAQYRARRDRLLQLLDEAGRDPASLSLAYAAQWRRLGEEVKSATGERRLFTGTADAIIDDIGQFHDMGVQTLQFNFQSATLSETIDKMQAFAEQVIAKSKV